MTRAYTAKEVAERWKVTPRMIQKMVANNELPGMKVGRVIRIPVEAVDRYEREHATGAQWWRV